MDDIEIEDLYQELIVDHSRRPRNFRRLENPTHQAEGFNPLCGDKVRVYVNLSNNIVRESIKGKSKEEVEQLISRFRDLVTGAGDGVRLGKLAVFSGLRGFPTRVKCATLVWHTLNAALERTPETVSTE